MTHSRAGLAVGVGVGAFGAAAAVLVKALRDAPTPVARRDSITVGRGGEYRLRGTEGQLEIRGLRNVGNSCFINAVLQSLASLPPFREYLEAVSPPTAALRAERAKESPFTVELLNLMNGLRPEKRSPTQRYLPAARVSLSPHRLRDLLQEKVERFGRNDQEDAQELFQMVMRLVGEEAGLCLKNKNRDKQSVIRMSETDGVGGLADLTPKKLGGLEGDKANKLPENPLSGSIAYVRRCTECNEASTRVERFVDLSLTLPEARDYMGHGFRRNNPVALATILRDFSQQQLVDDVECPKCTVKSEVMATEERLRKEALVDHSKDEEEEDGGEEEEGEGKEEELPAKRVPATIRSLLMHAPKTLCLHFPRRHQSPNGYTMKLEQHVIFPLHLDVTPFCYTGGHHTDNIGMPLALDRHAALASQLQQQHTALTNNLLAGRITKAPVPAESSSAQPATSTTTANLTMTRALQSPQQQPNGVKHALVGGSVEGVGASTPDSGPKSLTTLPNGATRGRGGGAREDKKAGACTHELESDKQGVEYDLKAVIVHQGGAENGHYIAFRKLAGQEEGRPEIADSDGAQALRGTGGGEGDWWRLSDETVKKVHVRDVLASQAYMLFYRRREAKGHCQGFG